MEGLKKHVNWQVKNDFFLRIYQVYSCGGKRPTIRFSEALRVVRLEIFVWDIDTVWAKEKGYPWTRRLQL